MLRHRSYRFHPIVRETNENMQFRFLMGASHAAAPQIVLSSGLPWWNEWPQSVHKLCRASTYLAGIRLHINQSALSVGVVNLEQEFRALSLMILSRLTFRSERGTACASMGMPESWLNASATSIGRYRRGPSA